MSRQIPTVRRKEIIYKRTYLDDHNNKFDEEFEKPLAFMRNQNPSQNYHFYPDPYDQLRKVNSKLDDILEHLRGNQKSNNEKKPLEDKSNAPAIDEHLTKLKEVCDRLEKTENAADKVLKTVPTNEELGELSKKVEALSNNQQELKEKLDKISNLGTESIDDLLTVVNDTRRDLEEKIANIKQLSDVNWIELDNKLDTFQRQQNGIQQQINDLMHILTTITSSRPSSANGHILSRSSSKSSSVIRPPMVIPTSRSPAPRPPSSISSKSSKCEKRKSYDTEKTITSNVSHQKEQEPALEVLKRDPGLATIPFEKERKTSTSTSSESFIAPLTINERRNSQPASVYYTKKTH